jgi:hypothetical protein
MLRRLRTKRKGASVPRHIQLTRLRPARQAGSATITPIHRVCASSGLNFKPERSHAFNFDIA